MDKEIILRPKGQNSETFSIRVDIDLLEKYNELSKITNYSRNELINVAMRYYIDAVKVVPRINSSKEENEEDKELKSESK